MENYVVLEHIGEGSFGKVYKARRKNTGFTVAMKFINKHGKNEKDIKNLRQEIGILSKLNHENIILMFDTFETDRDFCVVTEYGQGELFDLLQDDQRLPEVTVQQIAKQLVKALHYLHSNRIIHRDMKPQNVLIGSNGKVKLCDFGFARAMSKNTIALTSIKGTPLYMSPEQVKEQAYDATSDLWSLGVILYELFVGQPPFYTNSIYSLISHIVKDPVKYPNDISKDFKSLLQGLLQKNPTKRLTWPHLLDHPFVKESEADREQLRNEKIRLLSCGGFGGPRERLENIMGSDKLNLFATQNLPANAPSGKRSIHGEMNHLPHEKWKRLQKLKEEEESRVVHEKAVELRNLQEKYVALETRREIEQKKVENKSSESIATHPPMNPPVRVVEETVTIPHDTSSTLNHTSLEYQDDTFNSYHDHPDPHETVAYRETAAKMNFSALSNIPDDNESMMIQDFDSESRHPVPIPRSIPLPIPQKNETYPEQKDMIRTTSAPSTTRSMKSSSPSILKSESARQISIPSSQMIPSNQRMHSDPFYSRDASSEYGEIVHDYSLLDIEERRATRHTVSTYREAKTVPDGYTTDPMDQSTFFGYGDRDDEDMVLGMDVSVLAEIPNTLRNPSKTGEKPGTHPMMNRHPHPMELQPLTVETTYWEPLHNQVIQQFITHEVTYSQTISSFQAVDSKCGTGLEWDSDKYPTSNSSWKDMIDIGIKYLTNGELSTLWSQLKINPHHVNQLHILDQSSTVLKYTLTASLYCLFLVTDQSPGYLSHLFINPNIKSDDTPLDMETLQTYFQKADLIISMALKVLPALLQFVNQIKLHLNPTDGSRPFVEKASQVFIHCNILLGYYTLIPSEDEVHRHPQVSGSSPFNLESSCCMSGSDRWTIISLLNDHLKHCVDSLHHSYTEPTLSSRTVQDKTPLPLHHLHHAECLLEALAIIASTSHSMAVFDILLAHHIPSTLARCCCIPKLSFSSHPTSLNKPFPSFFTRLCGAAVRPLAVLLHTTNSLWRPDGLPYSLPTSPMPLECIMQRKTDQLVIDYPLGITQRNRRQSLSHDMVDVLLDSNAYDTPGIQSIIMLFHHTQQTVEKSAWKHERNLSMLRMNTLQVQLHVTQFMTSTPKSNPNDMKRSLDNISSIAISAVSEYLGTSLLLQSQMYDVRQVESLYAFISHRLSIDTGMMPFTIQPNRIHFQWKMNHSTESNIAQYHGYCVSWSFSIISQLFSLPHHTPLPHDNQSMTLLTSLVQMAIRSIITLGKDSEQIFNEKASNFMALSSGFSLLANLYSLLTSNPQHSKTSNGKDMDSALDYCLQLIRGVSISEDFQFILQKSLRFVPSTKGNVSNSATRGIDPGIQMITDREYRSFGFEYGFRSSGVLDPFVLFLSILCSDCQDRSPGHIPYHPPRVKNPLYSSFQLATVEHWQSFIYHDNCIQLFELICRQLQTAGSGELSPIGLVHCLHYLKIFAYSYTCPNEHHPVNKDPTLWEDRKSRLLQMVKREGVVGIIALSCLAKHLDLCQQWLDICDIQLSGDKDPSDANHVQSSRTTILPNILEHSFTLLKSIMDVIVYATSSSADEDAHPVNQGPKSQTAKDDAQSILEAIYRTQFIGSTIKVLRLHGSCCTWNAASFILGILSELVLSSSKFLAQFIDCNGLEVMDQLPIGIFKEYSNKCHLLSHHDPSSSYEQVINSIICFLQISSQLARNSEKYHGQLSSIFTPLKIIHVLTGNHPNVRAKACNLIGNLCRHSAKYYPILSTALTSIVLPTDIHYQPLLQKYETVLDILCSYCVDEDSNTRKFASFAVGNAAFHSDVLYPHLIISIRPLSLTLQDTDEKTRANAAGAIGNLIRNGGYLSDEMSIHRIPEQLLRMVMYDNEMTPKRIALFSLGTMAIYPSTRLSILNANSPSLSDLLREIKSNAMLHSDEVIQKYIARLKLKLNTPIQ